jgi:hypothetical protein
MPMTAAGAAVIGGQRKTRHCIQVWQRTDPRRRQPVVAVGVRARNLDAPEGI